MRESREDSVPPWGGGPGWGGEVVTHLGGGTLERQPKGLQFR